MVGAEEEGFGVESVSSKSSLLLRVAAWEDEFVVVVRELGAGETPRSLLVGRAEAREGVEEEPKKARRFHRIAGRVEAWQRVEDRVASFDDQFHSSPASPGTGMDLRLVAQQSGPVCSNQFAPVPPR